MQRRQVLGYVAGLAALAAVKPAVAGDFIEFTPEGFQQALDSGAPVMLAFLSDW